jgi:hypothetical protein
MRSIFYINDNINNIFVEKNIKYNRDSHLCPLLLNLA